MSFGPPIESEMKERKKNPKRIQREVRKQLMNTEIGTKSQQALKLQYEENKKARKANSREKKEAETKRKFELRQQKKKEKRRGR